MAELLSSSLYDVKLEPSWVLKDAALHEYIEELIQNAVESWEGRIIFLSFRGEQALNPWSKKGSHRYRYRCCSLYIPISFVFCNEYLP